MAFLDENGVAQLWDAVKDRLSGAFDSVEFNVAQQAANLVSGDSIATAFGKLAKNYSSLLTSISDLNTTLGNRISEVNTNLTNQINTKLNKSDVLANYTTTATGKALDASLGPAIKTKMDLADTLNTRLSNQESKYLIVYTNLIRPVASDGSTITLLKGNTDYWLHFPYTYTGYRVAGIVGYYVYAERNYTDCTPYVVAPEVGGISYAFHTSSKGDLPNPRGAFTVILVKT